MPCVRCRRPKNGLVLVPLIFSVNIWFAVDDLGGMVEIVLRAVGATVAFTLLSGAVYLINDLADVERDRAHPVKRNRAIASGDLPAWMARISAVIAVVVAGLISIAISLPLMIVALAYLLLNVAYTFKLKHVAILDVMSVAGGVRPYVHTRATSPSVVRCRGSRTVYQVLTLMFRHGFTS